MKRVVTIISIVVGLFALGGLTMFLTVSSNMKKINAIEVSDILFDEIQDGEYTGEYYYEEQIGAKVIVRVSNGVVTNIDIINHIYGLGGKAESITETIISEQQITVDDIAGATTSSHVIKLAINDALEVE